MEDWHDVPEALVGFDRDKPGAYAAGGPFFELLHRDYDFTHFGRQTSAKLVADFDAWDARTRWFSGVEFYIGHRIVHEAFAKAAQGSVMHRVWMQP